VIYFSSMKIHASTLSSWSDCPRRAAARLLCDEIKEEGYTLRPRQQSIGAIVGSGAHDAAGLILSERAQGRAVSTSAATEVAVESFRRQCDGEIMWDSTTPTRTAGEKQVAQQTRIFSESAAASIEPVGVEIRRSAQINNFTITGRYDVELVDGAIEDHKFGSGNWPAAGQLGGYSLLKKSANGASATALRINYVARVPVGKSHPGLVQTTYSVEACEREAWATIQRITAGVLAWRAAKTPLVFACNLQSVLCSPKYCSAHGTEWCELSKGK